jgi:S1-C subfamily serine protease
VPRSAAEILATGKVRHAQLRVAVQEGNQTLAEAFKLDKPAGALVTEVNKGSAAERAGLVSGEVILAVNGRAVDLSGDLPATGLGDPLPAIDGRPVNSANQATELVGRSDRAAALLVQRGGTKLYVALRLG